MIFSRSCRLFSLLSSGIVRRRNRRMQPATLPASIVFHSPPPFSSTLSLTHAIPLPFPYKSPILDSPTDAIRSSSLAVVISSKIRIKNSHPHARSGRADRRVGGWITGCYGLERNDKKVDILPNLASKRSQKKRDKKTIQEKNKEAKIEELKEKIGNKSLWERGKKNNK